MFAFWFPISLGLPLSTLSYDKNKTIANGYGFVLKTWLLAIDEIEDCCAC